MSTSYLFCSSTCGLLEKGVNALLADDYFSIPSAPASHARKVADSMSKWIPHHHDEVASFEKKLTTSLSSCIRYSTGKKKPREQMWSLYHQMRTMKPYHAEWLAFLKKTGSNLEISHIFCQYVGHHVFKQLIKLSHPLDECTESSSEAQKLTLVRVRLMHFSQ